MKSKNNKIIKKDITYKYKKNGDIFIIRTPFEKDALVLSMYMNKLSVEKTYIVSQGEKITKKRDTIFYQKDK